jgi:DNA-binding MarR family transcriptional regulator
MAEKEDSGRLRELEALEALAENPEARQVDLATRLGVAVGTVNWMLKRFTSKGYVKVKRIGRWRWHYLLTPRGFAEKARLTQRYLSHSMELYRRTRQEARRLLKEARERGHDQVSIEGDSGNDLLDVCRLTCLEMQVQIINRQAGDDQEDPVPVLRVEGRTLSMKWPER